MKGTHFLLLTFSGLFLFIAVGCGRFGPLATDSQKDHLNPGKVIATTQEEPEEVEEPFQGTSLSDLALFHKLSMALRGVSPTAEEYKSLREAIAQGKGQEYISQKTREYLNTTAYSERMVLKLEELFYLKTTGTRPLLLPGKEMTISDSEIHIQFSATDNLFRDIFSKNLSWDSLLTGKNYRLPIYGGEPFDLLFFKNVLGLPPDLIVVNERPEYPYLILPESYREISFDSDDPRIAGVITSPRFFSRFSATGLNKNRRRAAAIFRAFLCDPMISAIPEKHDSGNLMDLIFPEGKTVTESEIRTPLDALHGSQPDCMSCHYKLDPLGRALRESPVVLHEEPSPGALVFTGAKGDLVNMPGRGIGDVAKAISEQPEYVTCQVEHFWNWFIGSDIPLGKKTRTELVKSFDEVGRKANDFVAYLISRPEFKIRKSKDPQRAMVVEVKNFLRRCDSCHDGMRMTSGLKIPRLAVWPIGEGPEAQSRYWLEKISKSLDLENQGENRTMPTKSGFRPTLEELENIQKWIGQGAPNERGQRMVSP